VRWEVAAAAPAGGASSSKAAAAAAAEVDSDAEAAVFAGDRELQAVMRELDAALADMVEELPQQA
jgi:hypothetical protein